MRSLGCKSIPLDTEWVKDFARGNSTLLDTVSQMNCSQDNRNPLYMLWVLCYLLDSSCLQDMQ